MAAIQEALRQGHTLKEIARSTEEIAINLAVADSGGSLPKAAKRLGMTDRALQLRFASRRTQDVQRTESDIAAESQ